MDTLIGTERKSLIDRYLASNYVKFGREWPNLDCYGLVRLARVHLFGRPLLPSFVEIDPADKQGLTLAAMSVRDAGGFAPCVIHPGAIATAWRARLCAHVGIAVEVDGRLWVLETDEGVGPVLTRPSVFEGRYTRVIYYDD